MAAMEVREIHKKCIVAIAHKMIRLIYLMLTRREPYRDPMVDYDAMSAKQNTIFGRQGVGFLGPGPVP